MKDTQKGVVLGCLAIYVFLSLGCSASRLTESPIVEPAPKKSNSNSLAKGSTVLSSDMSPAILLPSEAAPQTYVELQSTLDSDNSLSPHSDQSQIEGALTFSMYSLDVFSFDRIELRVSLNATGLSGQANTSYSMPIRLLDSIDTNDTFLVTTQNVAIFTYEASSLLDETRSFLVELYPLDLPKQMYSATLHYELIGIQTATKDITLPININRIQIDMIHTLGVSMNSQISNDDLYTTILPEINAIWAQANISFEGKVPEQSIRSSI